MTHMYMRATNRALKYVLLHATDNRRGREVMKEALWSVTPDGSFTAFEHHHPSQSVLIVPEPDLAPLENLLWTQFAGKSVYMEDIYEWLPGTLYRKTHMHRILREYRNRKLVNFSGYSDRFAFDKNPVVHFPADRPTEAKSMLLF